MHDSLCAKRELGIATFIHDMGSVILCLRSQLNQKEKWSLCQQQWWYNEGQLEYFVTISRYIWANYRVPSRDLHYA